MDVSLLGKGFDLPFLLPQWERIPGTWNSTPALRSDSSCQPHTKPHSGIFATALCCFPENFRFSCAQLSVESRENSFCLVAPAPCQVLPCEQEPHEVLLSGADPALRHSVTWKFPIIQSSYTV